MLSDQPVKFCKIPRKCYELSSVFDKKNCNFASEFSWVFSKVSKVFISVTEIQREKIKDVLIKSTVHKALIYQSLIHFFPILSFGPPWKRLKTFSFLIYSGVSKGNIGNNWANIIFGCITNGRKGEWICIVFCVENYSQNLGRNNVQRFDNMVFVK